MGPTFLGSLTVRTVGVGVTFSLLLWKSCCTYRFWLPNSKNYWPFRTVVETFDSFAGATFLTFVGKSGTEIVGPTKGKKYLQHFSEPKSVGTTKELQQKSYNKWGIIISNTNSFHLLRDKNCRSNKRCESGSNKWFKSQTNTNS